MGGAKTIPPLTFFMSKTHYLDLSDIVPSFKEVKVKVNGEDRLLRVADPKTAHTIAAQYLRQEILDYEEKRKKREVELKDYQRLLVDQVFAVLSLDNDITREEVEGLGLNALNQLLNFLVSEEETKSFLGDRPRSTPQVRSEKLKEAMKRKKNIK